VAGGRIEVRFKETVMKHARSAVGQLVSQAQAQQALEASTLSAEQRDAVVRLLTADMLMTVLTAPAGAGKTRAMAEFALAWDCLVGSRVIGITTAENAARVMAAEACKLGAPPEAYNSAAFPGKVEGSSELRYPVEISAGDVLVLDESSMLSMSDLALILGSARRADAHVIGTDQRTTGSLRSHRRPDPADLEVARTPSSQPAKTPHQTLNPLPNWS
jgi:ATP-dependent exoDNAse (exonuclease V) alpha subunit